MKILFAGDTHGNFGHCRYLIQLAKSKYIDRIFILGDFGYWEHHRDGVVFLDDLSTLALETSVRVYFLDGNHDNLPVLIDKYDGAEYMDREGFVWVRPNVVYAPRGLRWTWYGTRFIALGGAYSVDKSYRLSLERKTGRPGSLWFPGEEMTDREMSKILEDDTPVDVILAHDKPLNSEPGWNATVLLECVPNQERLQAAVDTLRPRLYLHGHLHHRYTDTITLPGLGLMECTVEGLGADPDASWTPRYSAKDSWIIVDLEEIASVHR